MAGGGDAARLAETAQKQAGIETEIKAIDARFTREFPGFFDLLRPQAVDAPSIQEMLKGGEEAVLMILPTPFGTHMIAISDSDMDWQVSKLDEGMIDLAVRRLRWDLGADVAVSAEEQATWQDEGSGTYPFDRAMAHGLYRQLVEPVEGVLAGKRHVYVVAGGSLSSLPFGVLVTETPAGEDGNPDDLRATKWLADKYALIQLPSLQSLAFLRQFSSGGADKADGFLGFGDPALLGKAETRGGGKGRRGGGAVRGLPVASVWNAASGASGLAKVDVEALRKLARLPGTAIELEEMRSVLGAPMSAIVTGTAATEARVKQADLSHAAIIAFATHGLLAGEIDGSSEPGLVFTPPMSASSEDDGLLTMSEIAGLKMNADWVILSACNTAAGDGSQGATGLSGLAKAFFFAGAKSLLASHWPVRDDVASRITVRTIAIARDNPDLSHAEALQRAMREIRSNKSHDSATDTWAHPNAWAPFTLIGDARGR
jgi:CHAT domain-containing protein